MKNCPYCTGQNPDNAAICAYCRRPFPTSSPARKKTSSLTAFVILVIIVVCIGGAVLIFGRDDDTSTSPSQSAWYTCRMFIEDHLKAPKTAEFERYNASRVYQLNTSEWIVTMRVDAQNSFGAMIRSDFKCQLRDEGETWRLIDLQEQ